MLIFRLGMREKKSNRRVEKSPICVLHRSISFYSNKQALIQIKSRHLQRRFPIPDTIVPETVLALLNGDHTVDTRTHVAQQNEGWNSSNLLTKWLGHVVQLGQVDRKQPIVGRLLYVQSPSSVVLQEFAPGVAWILSENVDSISQVAAEWCIGRTSQLCGTRQYSSLVRTATAQLSYVADGFAWSCGYRLLLNALGNAIVTGQARTTVSNHTSFPIINYDVQFVIGSPHRARSAASPSRERMIGAAAPSMMVMESDRSRAWTPRSRKNRSFLPCVAPRH